MTDGASSGSLSAAGARPRQFQFGRSCKPREQNERTDGSEQSLDALGALGADFEEEEALLLGELGRFGRRHGALGCREVELVPGEADDDGRVRLALELEDPGLCFDEGGLGGARLAVRVGGRRTIRRARAFVLRRFARA